MNNIKEVRLPADDDALIPDRVFSALLGNASRASLWRWARTEPDFPRLIKLGKNNYRRAGDARAYLKERAAAAEKAV